MIFKLGRGLHLYKMYIKDGHVLTLTYFTTRSNLIAYVFKWGQLLQNHLMRNITANDLTDRRFVKQKDPSF